MPFFCCCFVSFIYITRHYCLIYDERAATLSTCSRILRRDIGNAGSNIEDGNLAVLAAELGLAMSLMISLSQQAARPRLAASKRIYKTCYDIISSPTFDFHARMPCALYTNGTVKRGPMSIRRLLKYLSRPRAKQLLSRSIFNTSPPHTELVSIPSKFDST